MDGLSWISIIRLGLVQTALGAMVLLMTSTMNRVMTVELQLLAILPGTLVALHHAVQIARPKWGYNSDMGGRRTPWIIGGLATLAFGVFLSSVATAWMSVTLLSGVMLAIVAYLLIGMGVGAAGTSLLAMLAAKVAPSRRAPAATIVWLMMIVGFIVTSKVAGPYLDPFTTSRLMMVTGTTVAIAFCVAIFAVWGVERSVWSPPVESNQSKPSFSEAFQEIWAEPKARAFTIFVFASMVAYSTQDLILEPFGGLVFGMTPGESTSMSGDQNKGVFFGMIFVAIAAGGTNGGRWGSVRLWTIVGCVASGFALFTLTLSAFSPDWPLRQIVTALGFANGMFAAAAIGWMMGLAGEGRASREGVRMGLWGGAQAIGFALGGFLGTVAVDVVRSVSASPEVAYASVFAAEGGLFLVSAVLAVRMQPADHHRSTAEQQSAPAFGAAELSS
ncbi:MAG: BCD family MFS transporter [Myxococcota bacterium]